MDGYKRVTQLYPALLVVAPITLGVLAFFRPEHLPISIGGVIVTGGFHLIAMRLIRDRGAHVQPQLWADWGGNPSVALLRWASADDHAEQSLVHARVAAATKVKLPSRRRESADPEQADRVYLTAVARLRESTRDHSKFPRVYAELVQYGWARNAYAAKPSGVAVSSMVLIAAVILGILSFYNFIIIEVWRSVFVGAGAMVVLVTWLVVVTPDWVKRDADRYSAALIGAAGPAHQ